jgi:8-oxo-dGTP pyrophosphatase MutT (NUDIX family)
MDAKTMNEETKQEIAHSPHHPLSPSQAQAQTWQRMKSEQIANCKVFKVRRDLSAREGDDESHTFYCIEAPDWINVIALTPEKQVVLIEQYRHGTEEITLEIPGGMADEGEDPKTAGLRELLEETGYAPRGEVVILGRARPNPAIQDNWVYHLLALDVEKTQDPAFDSTEDVKTRLAPLPEVADLIKDGTISHALVLAAFHHYSLQEYKL